MNAQTNQNFSVSPRTLLAVSFLILVMPVLFSHAWFLSFIGLIPLFFALDSSTNNWKPIKKAGVAFFVGLGYYFVALYPLSTLNTWWWTVTNGIFWEHKGFVYLVAVFILAVVCSALTFGLSFYIYGLTTRESYANLKIWQKMALLLGLPILWTTGELVRIKILAGLEWATFGQALAENRLFLSMAALGGVYMLSTIAFSLNFWSFLRFKSGGRGSIPGVLMAILLATIAIHGFFFNKGSDNTTRGDIPGNVTGITGSSGVDVAIISPILTTQELTTQAGIDHIFELLSIALAEPVQAIFLPENVFPTLIYDEETSKPLYKSDAFDRLVEISRENPEKSIILGLHTEKADARHNSALAIEGGKVIDIYHKEHLLPFTEKPLIFLEKIHIEPLQPAKEDVGDKNNDKNTEREVIRTKAGTFGPLICSEVLVTDDSHKTAQILVNLSNDNIFESARAARYNLLVTKIRSVQTGKTIIRSSKGTFSGIFDQYGYEIETFKKTPEILIGFVDLG